MATGDEEHSTRGRANALRLALSGGLPAEELTGRRMFDTYDLCLQCKGCKAECPSNVDVAKLKMEFLHHYYRRAGAAAGRAADGARGPLNRSGRRWRRFRIGLDMCRAALARRSGCRASTAGRPLPTLPAITFAAGFAAARRRTASRGRAARSCSWTIA